MNWCERKNWNKMMQCAQCLLFNDMHFTDIIYISIIIVYFGTIFTVSNCINISCVLPSLISLFQLFQHLFYSISTNFISILYTLNWWNISWLTDWWYNGLRTKDSILFGGVVCTNLLDAFWNGNTTEILLSHRIACWLNECCCRSWWILYQMNS